MNRIGRLAKMCMLMTIFGVILGAVAGFLVGWVLLASDMPLDEILSELLAITFVSGLYGGMFGGLYGGVSGFISGAAMAFVTAIGFREIRNVQRFRLVMGGITTVMTAGVFVLGGLWEFGYGFELTWASAMVLSIVIAVYASQIVSKRYVRDMAVRKKKVEA